MSQADQGAGDAGSPDGGSRVAGPTARNLIVVIVLLLGVATTVVALRVTTGDDAQAAPLPPHQGRFVVECVYSHSAPDDPIVFPGEPGQSHLHDFFGNTGADAFSTTESLVGGDTTCATTKDAASYWAPALFADSEKVDPGSSTPTTGRRPGRCRALPGRPPHDQRRLHVDRTAVHRRGRVLVQPPAGAVHHASGVRSRRADDAPGGAPRLLGHPQPGQ